jgi:hypothetical protein
MVKFEIAVSVKGNIDDRRWHSTCLVQGKLTSATFLVATVLETYASFLTTITSEYGISVYSSFIL